MSDRTAACGPPSEDTPPTVSAAASSVGRNLGRPAMFGYKGLRSSGHDLPKDEYPCAPGPLRCWVAAPNSPRHDVSIPTNRIRPMKPFRSSSLAAATPCDKEKNVLK